uniref:Fimbrial adhesin MrpH C-terminal domain-containing protein n=1 Tax=Providencia stuartii TaxID=588 RepID=A0AAI9DEJ8_PROST|nr:hypothetical protein [Providencia stuartii]
MKNVLNNGVKSLWFGLILVALAFKAHGSYTMYERSGYPINTTIDVSAATTFQALNSQLFTTITTQTSPHCGSGGSGVRCTFGSTYYNIQYQVWFPGAPEGKPFSYVNSSQNSCSFIVLAGNSNADGWTGKSMNASSADMIGAGGMLYNGTPFTVNKKCSDVTRSDIGILSGEVSGWGFRGVNGDGWVTACGNPCVFGNPVVMMVAVVPGSSNNPTQAVTSVRVDSGANVNTPTEPVSCVLSGDLQIDHGTLGSDNINGNSSSSNLSIDCSASASVTATVVSSTGNNKVDMRGGIVSTITTTPSTVTVSAGSPSSMVLSSTLNSTGNPVAGDYSGSATLIITYR